jgi:hypothetical protein
MKKYLSIVLVSSAERDTNYGGRDYGNIQTLFIGRKNNHSK